MITFLLSWAARALLGDNVYAFRRTRLPHGAVSLHAVRPMIFTYKYGWDHRVSTSGLFRRVARATRVRIEDLVVSPLPDSNRIIFIVGCGHSGTTLLAARFGNLKEVYVVPFETSCLLPTNRLADARQKFSNWFDDARRIDKATIVEKTPKHVHCWSRARQLAPNAKYIIVTRNPLDTCASLRARFGDLNFAITRYLIDSRAAARLQSKQNVFLVRYEEFVNNPALHGKKLLNAVGLDWADSFVEGNTSAYEGARFSETNMAKRQRQVAGAIRPHLNFWQKHFTPAEAARVAAQTKSVARQLGYDLHQLESAAAMAEQQPAHSRLIEQSAKDVRSGDLFLGQQNYD